MINVVEHPYNTTRFKTYDQQKAVKRNYHHIPRGLDDCSALFRSILADNHGGCGQLRVRRFLQGKHPMDVELCLVELGPKECGLD